MLEKSDITPRPRCLHCVCVMRSYLSSFMHDSSWLSELPTSYIRDKSYGGGVSRISGRGVCLGLLRTEANTDLQCHTGWRPCRGLSGCMACKRSGHLSISVYLQLDIIKSAVRKVRFRCWHLYSVISTQRNPCRLPSKDPTISL